MTCQSFNCDETRGAGFPAFEIAYILARPAWGNGYAREGAAAALRFARETLRREEITRSSTRGTPARSTWRNRSAPSLARRWTA